MQSLPASQVIVLPWQLDASRQANTTSLPFSSIVPCSRRLCEPFTEPAMVLMAPFSTGAVVLSQLRVAARVCGPEAGKCSHRAPSMTGVPEVAVKAAFSFPPLQLSLFTVVVPPSIVTCVFPEPLSSIEEAQVIHRPFSDTDGVKVKHAPTLAQESSLPLPNICAVTVSPQAMAGATLVLSQ
jgi:hypothetical protein